MKNLFLLLTFFVIGAHVIPGYANDAASISSASPGVTVVESIQADGTLVEEIHITESSISKDNCIGMGIYFGHCDLIAPAIHLSVGKNMVLKIYPQRNVKDDEGNNYEYEDPFYFYAYENNTSIVKPGSSVFGNSMHQPYDGNNGMLWLNYPHYQDWKAQTEGSVVLKFEGSAYEFVRVEGGYTSAPLTVILKVPIVVTK